MSLCKDLVFLILQFCEEENLKKTAHMLEQESGYFFDLEYFEELVLHGNWEETEKYLSSFTVVEDNKYSTKIYFEIRKQKYLEALDKHEFAVALDILLKDLKVFAQSNKELYKEMTQLLTLDDFREHSSLTLYGDTVAARKTIINEIRTVIEANPLLQGRTRFPQINKSRLRRLINQSLNWQHIHCSHPHPQPHIDTLFTDHKCPGPDNMQDQLNNGSSLTTALSASPLVTNSDSNQSVTESMTTSTAVNLDNLFIKDAASGDSESCHDPSKLKSPKPLDEVASPKESSSNCQVSANEFPSEFPGTVQRVLNMGSSPTTMDFHPVHETLLLVGQSVGDIELWDVTSAEKLVKGEFIASEVKSTSGALSEDTKGISVNRVRWRPDGSLFGVAYSKRVIRVYLYRRNGNCFQEQLEIDAHVGSVNDVAFSEPHDKLVIISCGDDKLIKVWDAVKGSKQYTFEGHDSPVYSLCPQMKDNVHFLFSITSNGEIKAWLFDTYGSRVTYDAPDFCCMRMAYSADGQRLFSCGTNKTGESYIVEWNDSEGVIIRNYCGLKKSCSDMVHFDTSNNRFLAAGDDHSIKIWDMDNDEVLAVIDADGGLPVRPYICFNKKGNLLAVSANDNQIKILANDHGRELLQTSAVDYGDSSGCEELQQSSAFVSGDASRYLTESFRQLSVNPMHVPCRVVVGERDVASEEALYMLQLQNMKLKGPAEFTKIEIPHISKVVEVPRCQSVLLSEDKSTMPESIYSQSPIRRLLYTHSGNGILALAEDGCHLLWKWIKSDANINGEANTKSAPPLWQPKKGLLMVNDSPGNGLACLTLSKNDSYVISASGGMINLHNMMSFKNLRSVMQPPPAATCILFYPPDNNIIAIGLDDSTILIYNIRVDKLISTLRGHSERVTGLAFSATLSVLVSCGVDTQIVLWDSVTWEKKKSSVLQISVGWLASEQSEITVQLDNDHKHFLAVHESQLAIYDTITLRRVKQWTIANFCTRIAHATYSCDSELVYVAMRDGILLILGASDLNPRFEIDPCAYLPPHLSSYVDPVVVAAHPKKPNQFALGLSNGEVVVIEPIGAIWTGPLTSSL